MNIKSSSVILVTLLLAYISTYGQDVDKADTKSVELKGIKVVGERKQVVYKIDRQRINASASITAQGGTAVDILSNMPSVKVDADGELSLRGSTGFLVYVDGKPSTLEGTAALRQISAASIENIELITNPSAKYKVEGDVGIINITTKQNTKEGLSGIVNLKGSTLGTWGGDALMNLTKGRHRWWIGGTATTGESKSDFNQTKTTSVEEYLTTSKADGTRFRTEKNFIGRLGWQYVTPTHHDFSLELQCGQTENHRGGDMDYYELRKYQGNTLNDNYYDSHDRYALVKDMFQAAFDYVWKIGNRGDKLSLSNRFRYDWYSKEYTESNMFEKTGARYEGTRGYEIEHHWDCDAQLSYLLHYRETGKLDMGYMYTTYSEHGDYKINYWDRSQQQFEWQDDLYAPFYYRRQVHSLYAMATDRIGLFDLNAGVRTERIIDLMEIAVPNADRNIKRWVFFPSAHVAYNTPRSGIFSLGYSYRTNRPGIWKMEPYITYEDYYTKIIGNPDIRPEYIHSIEGGWRKSFRNGLSIQTTAYGRARTDVVDVVRRAYEPGVTLDSIINAGNQTDIGVEFSASYKPMKFWNTTLNGNVFNYDFKAHYAGCSDNSGFSYQMGWMNQFTLGPTTRLQFDTHLVGPKSLTQGQEDAYCYCDLAYKKDLQHRKMALTLVAHDVFHTARYHNTRSMQTLNSETRVRPTYPNITLSLSFNFNVSGQKDHPFDNGNALGGSIFEGKDF